MNRQKIFMNKLYGEDIYAKFNTYDFNVDVSGGECGNFFVEMFNLVKPETVIEVGAWKGKTTIHLAQLIKKQKPATGVIFAIDTWLGSSEHYLQLQNDKTWGINKYIKNGRSYLYEQFLTNVIDSDTNDYIVPIVNTSKVGFEILLSLNVAADIIFIDADHGEEECYKDMCMYWELLKQGGILCGDDFSVGWYTVICAVNRFAKERGIGVRLYNDKWYMVKK